MPVTRFGQCIGPGAADPGPVGAQVPNIMNAEVTGDLIQGVAAVRRVSRVAHPDLVPVATEVFDAVLGARPNQVDRLREDVVPDEAALLSIPDTPGEITDSRACNCCSG